VAYTLKFAYAANLGSNNISAFRIGAASGALTKTGDFSGTNPFAIAVDPLGKFAYVGNEQVDVNNKSVVSAFTIDSASGALTAVPGSPYTAGTNADSVTVDPSGRFVYVGNVNSNDLSAYTITPGTGALTPITLSSSPFLTGGTQPFSVAVEPAGKFLYVANQSSGDVSAIAINITTGALSSIGSPIATGGSLPFSIAIDPYAFTIDASNGPTSGALTEMQGSPFPAGGAPFGMTTTGTIQ
jgi:6-phosphogluconolactonase (cycloisomerase 2 family)